MPSQGWVQASVPARVKCGGHGGPPLRLSEQSRKVEGAAVTGTGAPPHLSRREREIVDLLIAGQTYKQVGARLDISARTVEHYVERLKQRFHHHRLCALSGYLVAHGFMLNGQ